MLDKIALITALQVLIGLEEHNYQALEKDNEHGNTHRPGDSLHTVEDRESAEGLLVTGRP